MRNNWRHNAVGLEDAKQREAQSRSTSPGDSTAQFDRLSIGSAEDDAAPTCLSRLPCRSVMGRLRHLHTTVPQFGDSLVKPVGFEAEMKSIHRTVGMMRQLQNRIPQLQVGDLHASGNRMLEIILETKVAFVKCHGLLKVPDVECHVIDAFEHCRFPVSMFQFGMLELLVRLLPCSSFRWSDKHALREFLAPLRVAGTNPYAVMGAETAVAPSEHARRWHAPPREA